MKNIPESNEIEVPECTNLVIIGTFSDGRTSTLVIPEPAKVWMEWEEMPPEVEDILGPTRTKLYKTRFEFKLSAKSGERGAMGTNSPAVQ